MAAGNMGDDTIKVELSAGHIFCPDCEGGGTLTCDSCDGHNTWGCEDCSGRGVRTCNLEHEHSCDYCDGSGTCTCQECDEGIIDCGTCYGSGEVIDPDNVTDEGL